ncbi:hypothetical protein [Laspinema olomoucense]|uniref:Nucleic acid binding OB-fold tRNA/helicase-type n=2 Tax=Laspinema TaxID=2584823 RepID=A0ABT2NK15_9CYAN|nr:MULTISPECIES: hypothetical protein [unclassified Laspinema]MCT7974086.1 hypothetical protein [Laspinema sp. D3d]MCT7981636.1 hypothetical protein [Laspinema sp. D3b]MCT7991842.1 hypothetical protein [Laspinema sp. D3a]MCT7997284.1 hypothetical protein [Laspinema sp. D3c]
MTVTVLLRALNQTVKFCSLSLMIAGLGGCTNLVKSGVGVTDIEQIHSDWQKQDTVYLKGIVENRAPFLQSGAYQLQDATGSIWVMTDSPLPNVGDEMVMKGQVTYQSIPIAGQELGEVYLKELEQLKRESSAKNNL